MYDIEEMKRIPCSEIAGKYGIQLTPKHDRVWGKLRPEEKTSSFSINLKVNLWYDFGANKGGSVIDLVAELEGCSKAEAINKLGKEYGLELEEAKGWHPLTDSQYKELGIQPELATMNFAFDLNKHTEDELKRWSQKYGMPVRDLAIKYPKAYDNMVVKIGLRGINNLRDTYYSKVDMYHEPGADTTTKEFLKASMQQDTAEINKRIDLLQKAITATNVTYTYLQVDINKDLDQKPVRQMVLTEDERIRQHIVDVYTRLFNYHPIAHFSAEQARALQDLNKAFSNASNKYMPVEGIKLAYNQLGTSLDRLEREYKQLVKESKDIAIDKTNPAFCKVLSKAQHIETEMTTVRNLFLKCSTVIEGIREANFVVRNELKQASGQTTQLKQVDLSR